MQTAGRALSTGTSLAGAGTLDCSVLINQLLEDRRRKSLSWNEGQRNPFDNGTVLANDVVAVESAVAGGSLAEAVRIAKTLRLEGTAVSARTSVATVNGRVFSTGETVDVRKLGVPDAAWQFARLEQIEVDSVVLRFGDFRATMRLPSLRRDYEPYEQSSSPEISSQ